MTVLMRLNEANDDVVIWIMAASALTKYIKSHHFVNMSVVDITSSLRLLTGVSCRLALIMISVSIKI